MAGEPPTLEYTSLPSICRIIRQPHADGVVFIDQPLGRLGRETAGVVVLLIVMILLSAAAIRAIWSSGSLSYDATAAAIAILAWVPVLALLRQRIRMGRTPVVVGTQSGQLFIVLPRLRGPCREEFPVAQVASIDVIDAGLGLHGAHIGHLRIRLPAGRWAQACGRDVRDVFAHKDLRELQPIAYELCQLLGLPAPRVSGAQSFRLH